MLFPYDDPDDERKTPLEVSGASEAIIVPPVEEMSDSFRGSMTWEARLHNTQEKLKRLSDGFPFLSQGSV